MLSRCSAMATIVRASETLRHPVDHAWEIEDRNPN